MVPADEPAAHPMASTVGEIKREFGVSALGDDDVRGHHRRPASAVVHRETEDIGFGAGSHGGDPRVVEVQDGRPVAG